ncbi:YscW family type III secretion system pilotin [Aeromonas salmonicida]|uniref:YscW family type III secretion system pilotin n=1 Tax=Aeromonas salmonicida TaxID=645 RepID=UPI00232DBA70|nr:YscW family type III secretion system pilotin [Aeromonas salmonicida]WCH23622.1 YscW family type III secretion system pilotin [Aeromonas salmonicida]
MRPLLLCVLLTLGGCVTTTIAPPMSQILKGEVHLNEALPHPATVEVTVLSQMEGRPLQVASIRYEVTMLPLVFDMRLTPLQWGKGELYVRTRLRFVGNSAIQATGLQKVHKVLNGRPMVILLQPRSCYPKCQ